MNEQTTRSTSEDWTPYVEFKDLPDTTTPIDATNLNNLQIQLKQDIADNQSVPSGGTTGQVLKKTSDTDYDIEWANETSQVVDSLDGNSTTLAPSQRIVKENIDNINKINTDITVDDNGWTKVKGINVTTYFKNYKISTSIAGNGFLNFPDQPLPVDITTYDSTKMIASLATRFTDGAGIINAGISNGYKSISMCGQNKYGGQINGIIVCNFRIDVYNSSTNSTNE